MPPAAYATWRATLAENPGHPPRILAWAPTADGGLIILSPAALSRQTESGEWRSVGWHEIERGSWNSETEQLLWQTYEGGRGSAALPGPARIPEVFQERVAASILVERFVPVAAGSDRGVVVHARRNLADDQTEIGWHTTLTRGVTWRTPGVRDLADAALAELRREYDGG